MAKIIVLGGGMSGLATGLLLRRDGHEVTVLEADEEPVPASLEKSWEDWSRRGVSQFRQAHYLTPRGYEALRDALPDVCAALETAGGLRFNPLGLMPPTIAAREPSKGDERFVTITARRPVLEQIMGAAADTEPDLEIRRGTPVRVLTVNTYDGVPHVTGVRTETGAEMTADLVIDAMGRRSQLPRWLSAAGAQPVHEEAEDSGFLYYTRYFCSRDGGTPKFRAPLLTPMGTFSILTIPADNGTWSVTLYASAGDQALKRFRDPDRWAAVLAACPLHAQWLEGEPMSGVMAMGGIVDRYRRLFVDGALVATGVALVGDAWACTNPSLGRGMTLALLHAQRLRDVIGSHLDGPREFAETWDAVTEAELTPWYRETVQEDRARLREVEALRAGQPSPPPADAPAALRAALIAAMPHDANAFRAYLANRCCLTLLEELWADSAFVARIRELAGGGERPPLPGPDRERLERLLNGPLAAT